MKILIVSDKFKGSLTSQQAGEAIAKGIRAAACQQGRSVEVEVLPVADGGDGLLEAIAAQVPVRRFQVESLDPLERPMMADLLMAEDGSCAYIEMARTCGLWLLDSRLRNPRHTSTRGVGELLKFAVSKLRVPRILIGLGGSATNDGGVGLLTALGYRFEADGELSDDVAAYLSSIRKVDDAAVSRVLPDLGRVKIDVATDVENPLLGSQGATFVFGQQKGGSRQDLEALEKGMAHWASVAADFLGEDYSTTPGAGAAGGVGFALSAFLKGRLCRGWEMVASISDMESKIQQADWIITGEGCFDAQSLQGKLPYGVAQLCTRYQKPLSLFCGRSKVSPMESLQAGIQDVFSLQDIEKRRDLCLKFGAQLLTFLAQSAAVQKFQ